MPRSRFSNHKFHREPAWRPARRAAAAVPLRWRAWLLDQGSLTTRLRAASNNQFRVRILSQGYQLPRLSEARSLGLNHRELALVREVILYGCNQPWVYARSIMPLPTLTGRLRRWRKLDNRPLGALLFQDKTMRRGTMEIASLNSANTILPIELRLFDTSLWGRRSVFWLDNKPLLVSEIFLPTFTAVRPKEAL